MRLYNAIREFDRKGFKVEQLAVATNRVDLNYLEQYFIIVKNADQELNGYNMTEGGGMSMREFSPEHKAKISASMKGKIKSAEHVEKMREIAKHKIRGGGNGRRFWVAEQS